MSKLSKSKQLNPAPSVRNDYNLLHSVCFWGIAILLFLPPFFRGLYFAQEQQKALIFAVIVFWTVYLWKWIMGEKTFLSHPLDYFVLSIPLVYIISAINAVNYGLAVDEIVKVTMYFLVYWSVVQLVREKQHAIKILHIIYISAFGVALSGVIAATGLIDIRDSFVDGRIYSTLQYPNSLASFLIAALILGMYLWWHSDVEPSNRGILKWLSERKLVVYPYVAGNFLLMSVIFGTGSNGGLIVLVFSFIIFALLLPGKNKANFIVHFMYVIIPAYLSMVKFLDAVKDKHPEVAWLWIVFGLALAVAGHYLFECCSRFKRININVLRNNFFTVVLLLVFGTLLAGLFITFIGDPLIIKKIKIHSIFHRIYFIQDAMKMIIDRPLLGWGGGGWREAYRAYQSYFYNSSQVHSYHFQVIVETGVLGLLAIGGMWVTFGMAAARNRLKNQLIDLQMLLWSCSIAALVFFVHALIDFDLSYSSLAMVLWTLFALVRRFDTVGLDKDGIDKVTKKKTKPNSKSKPHMGLLVGVTSISLIIILFTISLASAQVFARQSVAYAKSGNLSAGINYIQKAASHNPFKADYYITLAQMYLYAGNSDSAFKAYEAALSRSKYSTSVRIELGRLAMKQGDWENAIEWAEEAVTLSPFIIQRYEFASSVYKDFGIEQLKKGHAAQAKIYLIKAAEMPDRINHVYENIDEGKKQISLKFLPSSQVFLSSGISKYLLKDFNGAFVALNQAIKERNIRSEALLWLNLVAEKQGENAKAEKYLSEVQKLSPDILENYDQLKGLPIVN